MKPTLALLLASLAALHAAESARPNVIVMIADDLGYGDVSCLSHGAVKTPNLDRLAQIGVKFTAGYVTAPLCAPSRAGFFTGRYQQRFGFINNEGGIPTDVPLLPGVLRNAGYHTGLLGKWHSAGPMPHERGCFDETLCSPKPGPFIPYHEPRLARNGKVEPSSEYSTDLFAREAEAFIERNKDKPFSLTVAFNAPHIDHVVKPFHLIRKEYDAAQAAGKVYDAPKAPTARPGEAAKYASQFPGDSARADTAATIAALDEAIGRILDKLRQTGLARNTIVFFFADNGAHPENRSENGVLRDYKWSHFEGGLRVPFLAAYPGVFPAGLEYSKPVSTLDIFPTVTALAGVKPPANLDGVNLTPYLKGENSASPHTALFFDTTKHGAVRQDQWKLVWEVDGQPQLFDLANDIAEKHDLASTETNRVKELTVKWQTWHAQMSVASPTGKDSRAAVQCPLEFAPQEGMLKSIEQPLRAEICLNGLWQFQPVNIPAGFVADQGKPPLLGLPDANQWEKTLLKIPSPWNVNSLGHDPKGGGMDARTFPSYPEHWNQVRMGWLRKRVTIPDSWKGQRVFLHLEAVAGDCRVLVNGKEMGSHFDVALPGQFDITSGVSCGKENEILLGIRDHRLFAEKGAYGKLTYPTGSMWLMDAVGVWQDVFLLAKPPVHIEDVFFQPLLDKDLLVAEVELVNDTAIRQAITIDLPVYKWITPTDTSKKNMLKAPEISWSLGEEALRMDSAVVQLASGEKKTVVLQAKVNGRLEKWELWNRGKPHLYAGVAEVKAGGKTMDKKFQRFGWREIKLQNGDLLVNGKKTKLMQDGWHFTGVPIMSRRYAWGWYTLAMDANVNLVRPHAMPYPRYFYDMADEMGMLLMDESGIFGSHCNFNYDSPDFWRRNAEHIAQLVRRDRNHPSIVAWSVANEVRCVLVTRASQDYQEKIYDKIFNLEKLARSLDPTRQWVQSDGDKDLNGRQDVWTIHCGGEQPDTIPPGKLWGVTEGGSSYYGKPGSYEQFVGDRAYRSFKDRMDALAKEDYKLIRTLRQQDADICNVWNLVWHGLKPLPLGLKDVAKKRLELTDGIFFGPYVEGKPGIQPERIAPFSTTVNPGYDPSLPLYDPHPLYLSMQAAMHPDGPQPCEWDHFEKSKPLPKPPVIADPVKQASFAGNTQGVIYGNLKSMGVPFSDSLQPRGFLVVDVSSVAAADAEALKQKADAVVVEGGAVLLVGMSPATQVIANRILPAPIVCVDDVASSLLPNLEDARTACLSFKELYFAESFINPTISRSSLSGALVEKGTVLLRRNNTDWLRWLSGPEHSKTISIYRSELENRQLPVLVEYKQGKGSYLVSTLEMDKLGDEHVEFYRKLLATLGLKLAEKRELTIPAFKGDVLVSALSLGRFGAGTVDEAVSKDFIGEKSVRPAKGSQSAGKRWELAVNNGDRFVFRALKQGGPEDVYSVYFSYWVYSPIDLGDLLNAGPNLPQVTQVCFVSDVAKVYLNGNQLEPVKAEPVDYRTRLTFQKLPLKQGWNHFLIKVASDSLKNADPGTLAVRLSSNNASYDNQLKTAIERAE